MRIVKEGASFGIMGLAQLGVDWLTFVLLTHVGVLVVAGNLIARIAGASIGFSLNRHWTFQAGNTTSAPRHATRFAAWWLITTLASTGIISTMSHVDGLQTAWLVKPVIDAFLAGCGFLVSKFWIYRS